MTIIKNNCLTKALPFNTTPYKAQSQETTINMSQLNVLDSTRYLYLDNEKQLYKSEKQALRALKKSLVSYDYHTIHKVHLKDRKKLSKSKTSKFLKTLRPSFLQTSQTIKTSLLLKDLSLQIEKKTPIIEQLSQDLKGIRLCYLSQAKQVSMQRMQ